MLNLLLYTTLFVCCFLSTLQRYGEQTPIATFIPYVLKGESLMCMGEFP